MFKCPSCHEEISGVIRYIAYEIGDAYAVDEEGAVNPGAPAEGLPTDVWKQVEGKDIRYECPKCRATIECHEVYY